ncbi:MAG: hypothetical protein IIA85_02705 [Nanoarchaeota archaeon]|nr:hypothetical protein [Nanoarchaeota archaeon]
MKEIKILLEERGELEDVRKSLVSLLNVSLGILKEVANKYGPGDKLYEAIKNYDLIYNISKDFLSEEGLEEIKERYGEIREIWAPKYTKNEKKI